MRKLCFEACFGIISLLLMFASVVSVAYAQTPTTIDATSINSLAQSVSDMSTKQGASSAMVYVMSIISTVFGAAFYKTQLSKDALVLSQSVALKNLSDENNRRLESLIFVINETNKNQAVLIEQMHSRPCLIGH